jgi:hypothetical protein
LQRRCLCQHVRRHSRMLSCSDSATCR